MALATVPMPSPQIKVLLVMTQLLFREALASLLVAEPDIRVAAQVSSLDDAVRICATTPVECTLVEFDSSRVDLTTFCASLRGLAASSRILLMGDILRFRELEVLRPLVGGVLPNSSNSGILVESIRRIAAGQTWRHLPLLDGSAALPHKRHSPTLTERQQMVLHLVSDGLSNKECAQVIGVSDSSIKCTVQQLFGKMNVSSRAQLVRCALESYPDLLRRPHPMEQSRGMVQHSRPAFAMRQIS
jgi:two-component system nitrate/nitrite response regulator NarL